MIIGPLEIIDRSISFSEHLAAAIQYLRTTDLGALKTGKHVIDGELVYALVHSAGRRNVRSLLSRGSPYAADRGWFSRISTEDTTQGENIKAKRSAGRPDLGHRARFSEALRRRWLWCF